MEIKENEIYAIKLTSGQEIVTKIVYIGEEGYNVEAPLTIGQGNNGMEFLPAMFTAVFGAPALIHYVGVAMVLPCRDDVKEAYEESIKPQSEILTPGKKQIITG